MTDTERAALIEKAARAAGISCHFAEAALDAVGSFSPAQVRALEWSPDGEGAVASAAFRVYSVWPMPDGFGWLPAGACETVVLPTLEAAKAACQADYERRILSTLEPAPPSTEREGK
jgi:hypothetical protein